MPHWIALIPGSHAHANSHCNEAPILDAHHLGWWCLQFTPRVAILDDGVIAELEASHRLFGGKACLVQRIENESRQLGCLAVADGQTAAAAMALARCPGKALLDLPLHAIPALRPHEATLARVGCRTLRDVRALPRSGLSRRFGAGLIRALDELDGTQAQAFDWLTLPAVFESRLELPGRVDSAEQLGAGASILLHRLCAWLAGRRAGVHGWTLKWRHDFFRQRDVSSQGECTVRLGSPSRDARRLTQLMQEHLQRIELAGPVDELLLHAHDISVITDNSHTLFPEISGETLSAQPDALRTPAAQKAQQEALIQLVERLSARLGPERVQQGRLVEDHRPEQAQAWFAAAQAQTASASVPSRRDDLPLPTWLLAQPQALSLVRVGPLQQEMPFYQGRLQLLAGPHRIEAGWWDGAPAARDYYIARSERAGLLWIFKDRSPSAASGSPWYLHGLFA